MKKIAPIIVTIKNTLYIMLTLSVMLTIVSCSAPSASLPLDGGAAAPVSVAVIKGPGGISAAYLLEQAALGNSPYTIELADTPEQVVAMLTNGSVDIAALPTNLAANLYAKTGGSVQMAAITSRGMLYMLEYGGDNIHSWEDLRGQTIYATGRGANPEYILDYLLRANGLTPDEDVYVEFKSEHAELAALLASGMAERGVLPEPFVTSAMMQSDALRVAFDLTEEWASSGADGQLAMTGLVARREFAAAHPEAMERFLTDMEQSINYALTNVAEAAQLCEKYGVIAKAAVAQSAIPRCNIVFYSGLAMKDAVCGYYEVLFNANPQAIGGALPDEDFYYIR